MTYRPTPRTLAECRFDVGYPEKIMNRNRALDHLLAWTIGILIGIALVSWWAA